MFPGLFDTRSHDFYIPDHYSPNGNDFRMCWSTHSDETKLNGKYQHGESRPICVLRSGYCYSFISNRSADISLFT